MVYLVISRAGLDSFVRLGRHDVPLWVGAGVLSDAELGEMRDAGFDVSDFNYEIASSDAEAIEGARGTIEEHHPGLTIRVV